MLQVVFVLKKKCSLSFSLWIYSCDIRQMYCFKCVSLKWFRRFLWEKMCTKTKQTKICDRYYNMQFCCVINLGENLFFIALSINQKAIAMQLFEGCGTVSLFCWSCTSVGWNSLFVNLC